MPTMNPSINNKIAALVISACSIAIAAPMAHSQKLTPLAYLKLPKGLNFWSSASLPGRRYNDGPRFES
jgi:hypothetical protein